MMNYLLSLPTFVMCLIGVLVSAGISILGLLLVRKKLNWETFQENHEVGGFLFNALGLIYAVLVAFVVFATWEEYESARIVCDNEANALQDLFLNSEGLPKDVQPAIREKITEYLECVINEDWPLLSKDQANPVSKQILADLWQIYSKIDSFENEKQSIYFSESLSKLNETTDYRRLRILSSQNHIPAIIWTVIIIGALTSVGFSLFFGTRNLIVQATMTSLFAMTNAIVIIMLLALDHPFTGDIKITPEPYEFILNSLQSYMPK